MPLDIAERTRQYRGMWKRVPIGLCSFISPFNFPLNLVAQKVAPAIAVGCPFILKPASMTPIGALIIGEVLAETDLPKGAFSILPCHRAAVNLFTTDVRIKFLSFTGSAEGGWELKSKAGKKPVVLESGGNAACIVHDDTDLDDAVKRIIVGAFYQSGQSCISVQRILVHENIYAEFVSKLVIATKALKTGYSEDPETFVGPMISEAAAMKLENWINAAKNNGAKILCGGTREGAILTPTLLENVGGEQLLSCEEALARWRSSQNIPILMQRLKWRMTVAMVCRLGFLRGIFIKFNRPGMSVKWVELLLVMSLLGAWIICLTAAQKIVVWGVKECDLLCRI